MKVIPIWPIDRLAASYEQSLGADLAYWPITPKNFAVEPREEPLNHDVCQMYAWR